MPIHQPFSSFTFISRHEAKPNSTIRFNKSELDLQMKNAIPRHYINLFTCTLQYIRNLLVLIYGNSLGCYSGAGGEVWTVRVGVTIARQRSPKSCARER